MTLKKCGICRKDIMETPHFCIMDEINDPFCRDCKKKKSQCQCKMDPKVVEFCMKNKVGPKIILATATPVDKTKKDFETILDMLQGIDRRCRICGHYDYKKCHPVVQENKSLPKQKITEEDIEKDVEIVMKEANVSLERATEAYEKRDGDIVNTIMDLSV